MESELSKINFELGALPLVAKSLSLQNVSSVLTKGKTSPRILSSDFSIVTTHIIDSKKEKDLSWNKKIEYEESFQKEWDKLLLPYLAFRTPFKCIFSVNQIGLVSAGIPTTTKN